MTFDRRPWPGYCHDEPARKISRSKVIWRSTLGCRAFSVAGPTAGNLLPDQLRGSDCTRSLQSDSHSRRSFSTSISVFGATEVLRDYALYKSTFYLLTYLLRWRRGVVVASLVSINEVNLRWVRLVLGWFDRVRVRLREAALYFGM